MYNQKKKKKDATNFKTKKYIPGHKYLQNNNLHIIWLQREICQMINISIQTF